ncbi:tetratricopeptide repeat protein [uncultured Helicobacter sp.]|uniref:tetratricopeptide repeat protein n=1 Tax=uncultured Helicobacter sp. TaxID=175537 RepID=UPI00263539ED|nr:tetratricopeptide repeat protein [uncultured Helicobacter sp.]
MPDINSIQEDKAPEVEQKSSAGFKQKLTALLDSLQNRFAKFFTSPTFDKIKQNHFLLYSAIGGVALLVMVLLLLLILLLLPSKKSAPEKLESTPLESQISQEEMQKLLSAPLPAPSIEEEQDSSVDNLIIKGNMLYDQGYRQEAYEVFRKIADFSQSIANYNLGTMELKSELYQDSIAAYNDSIQTGQNVSVSAINAAVAAFKLDRFDLYGHYVKIANDNLSEILNEPFYSYAYALVSYYQDRYFETLSPLLNPNSIDFATQNNRLAAHVFTIFGDDVNALNHLKAAANPEDNKAIGLLYARQAEYASAKAHLLRYLQDHPQDIESLMALQIIELKLGNYAEAAANLDSITSQKKFQQIAKITYPIKVVINPELFDVSMAQKTFWERDFENKDKIGYKMLFYFAPYRVFDAKKALEEIAQASNFAHINITEGKNILLRSATTSKIDREIIRTLVQLESKDLRAALKFLKTSTASNPNHAILYYNLGLVYAQLGQYEEAYTNFIRAYYLDQSDYISGIFAVLSGRFSHKDTDRVVFDMVQSYQDHEAQDHIKDTTLHTFYGNFLNYLNDNQIQESDWIAQAKVKEPIYYALEYVYALKNKDKEAMLEHIGALKNLFPNDVVVNILSILTKSFGDSVQDISISMYNLFNSDNLDLRPLYYGGALPRELYVYTGFITGSLQNQAKIMQAHLTAGPQDPRGTMQTLGLIGIYQKDFQKAYTIFNTLVDELHESDSHTRFLAAVSAVGAGNYGDATLLLQLAKMETPNAYEARYALGLLYQAAGNLKAAATSYNFISLADFRSEFFDFQIDTQKIYSYELESQQDSTKKPSTQSHQNPRTLNFTPAIPQAFPPATPATPIAPTATQVR